MSKTIRQVYDEHEGKVSDKWQLYLDEWDRLLFPYRDQEISLIEIGVQNGGSLEIWGKCFSNAKKLIGCDIDQKCEQLHFNDPRIALIVGDANSDDCESKILAHSQTFDIVLDDGSHKSSDIVRSFARYFPHLNDNGIYIIEDLHCSYWENFEGGLNNPLSAISFFKRLADIINYEHWRNNKSRGKLLTNFSVEFGIKFDDLDLARIHSIEFVNSLCTVRKLPPDKNVLGKRLIVGSEDNVASGWKKFTGTSIQDIIADIKDDENLDVFELMSQTNSLAKIVSDREQSIQILTKQMTEKEQAVQLLLAQLEERAQHVATMQAQLSEREQQVATMQAQLVEREQEVAKMQVQLADKEKLTVTLQEQLAEWKRTGRSLTKQLSDKKRIEQEQRTELEQQKRKYEEDLLQKVHTSQTLLSRLAKKEDELERIETEKKAVISQLEFSTQEANSFSSQLWEIKHSRAWHIVQLLWKLRIRFFPSGSIQTRFIRSIINNLQVLKNEGVISFFRRAQTTTSNIRNQKRGANKAAKDVIQKSESSVSLVHPNPVYISDEVVDTTRPNFDASTSSIHPDDPTGLLDRVIGCLKYNDFLISISHDDYLTINFGVQMFMTNEQNLYDKRKISYLHLYPLNGADYLINDSPLVIGLNVDSNHIGKYSVNDIVNLLENLLIEKHTCMSLNLHQFKGWTLNALCSIISAVHPDHLLFYIHDFFAVCPQYTLLWNQREFCNAPPMDSNVCNICIFIEKRKKHLPLVKQLFTSFPFLIIAPSKSTTSLWQKTFPELKNETRIEPHIFLKESSVKLPTKNYKTIRIAYAGQGVRQKGWDFWRNLVDKFAPYTDYEFFHLGSRAGQYRELFERVRVTPENRTAMLDALRKHQIDVLFHWSIVPETFSYVLYEAIGAGCFVLTTNQSGNVADYVNENKNGLVFESYNDLVNYLTTPDNLRKDLLDFRKKYPRSFTLEHNDTIANMVKIPSDSKSVK